MKAFGIAGLVATFSPPEGERMPASISTRHVPFVVPAGLSDKEIADAVHARLQLPLTGPIPEWAVQRDAEGRLQLNFYTVNGPFRVTVLDDRSQLRIITERTGIWQFINHLHAALRVYDHSGDWRMAVWTWYIEVALWSFLFMALSGLYLWLSSRPRYLLALIALLGGSGSFLILYFVTR